MGLFDFIYEDHGEKKKEEFLSFEDTPKEIKVPTPHPALADEVGQFPKRTPEPVTWTAPPVIACEPYMDPIIALYAKGFEELNKPGYDFYEYYKTVKAAGEDNPEMYKMAFTMAKAMDSSVSKEGLLQHSEYYLTEINKVYEQYVSQGKQKQSELQTKKTDEDQALKSKLQSVQVSIQSLLAEESKLKIEVSAIESKYAPQLTEIMCKLEANDAAKKGIFENIDKVKQGIKTNL